MRDEDLVALGPGCGSGLRPASARVPPRYVPRMLLLVLGAHADDRLLTNARLWDGTGAPVRDGVAIEVRGDRIVSIGAPPLVTDGLTIVDLHGATVIPGLIDSHVHLVAAPGAEWRADTEQERVTQLHQQMAALIACGVTTIFDPGTSLDRQPEADAWRARGGPGPENLHAGAVISPTGGYLDRAYLPDYPSVADRDGLRRQLDANVAAGATAVKVALEPGFAEKNWPVFDSAMRAAIVEEAAARSLPLLVHATTPAMLDLALEMSPAGLVHPAAPLSDRRADRVAASGAWVISTLSVHDVWHVGRHPERLARPLLDVVVPPAQLATAREEGRYEQFLERMFDVIGSSKPGWYQDIGAGLLNDTAFIRGRERSVWAALRKLRARGVRLVMGSDSGNWPMIPYLFHGTSSLTEIELLGAAGLSPEEALTAATRTPAAVLGIGDRVGTIEVGKEADLVILREDPLASLAAVWTVQWTMADGVMHTPAEWMERATP